MPAVLLRCRNQTFDVSNATAIRAALQQASRLAAPAAPAVVMPTTATTVPTTNQRQRNENITATATDDDELLSNMMSTMTLK